LNVLWTESKGVTAGVMGHMKRTNGVLAVLILAFSALAGSASGSSAKTSVAVHQLRVDLVEWAVIPSNGLVAAGPLRVKVANDGQLRHELDIVPTESWGQKLRVREGRAVGEDAAAPIVVAPGQTRSARINLAPGYYVLLDNIRGHYAAGGAVSIVVG
jgi:uncharacterized cupredoxin-like copper-binding protein